MEEERKKQAAQAKKRKERYLLVSYSRDFTAYKFFCFVSHIIILAYDRLHIYVLICNF